MKSIDYNNEVGDIEVSLKNDTNKRSKRDLEDDVVNYATNDRNYTVKSNSIDEFVQLPPPSQSFGNGKKPVIVRNVKNSQRVTNTGPATFSSDRNSNTFIKDIENVLLRELQNSKEKFTSHD